MKMQMWFVRGFIILAVLLVSLVLPGCSLGTQPTSVATTPSVSITQPVSGQTAQINEQISVESTSTSPNGIQRVELWVDNVLTRVDVNPDESTPYVVSQPWQSDKVGSHVIQVKAFDIAGGEGASPSVVITLEGEAQASAPTAAEPSAENEPTATTSVSGATDTLIPTWTPSPPLPTFTSIPIPTITVMPVCTAPACQAGEVYHCPGDCPGGCGTQCATPTAGPPTATPPNYQPTGIEPHPTLKDTWEKPGVKAYLGYPLQPAVADRLYAKQHFERGFLYWWDRPGGPGLIYVVFTPDPSATQGYNWSGPYDDTWEGEDPYSCDLARTNPLGPVAGFGKLWCDYPDIAQAIGAPRESESGTGESTNYGIVQLFQGGQMLYSPLDRQVWVLLNGGTWQRHGL
jgi:hypothetical protein